MKPYERAISTRFNEFIRRATAKHGGKYDYSKVRYTNARTKVCIICPVHGEFWQTPGAHSQGNGCYKCGRIEHSSKIKNNRIAKIPDVSHIITPKGSAVIPVGTKGKYALIDEEDYIKVSKHIWHEKNGYARSEEVGLMHRFILGTPEGMVTDHRDLDRLNNRKNNIRVCSQKENSRNYPVPKINNKSSRYKGVCWSKKDGKWISQIGVDGNLIYLGSFDNEADAARAYDTAATKHFKDFARLNFSEKDKNNQEKQISAKLKQILGIKEPTKKNTFKTINQ